MQRGTLARLGRNLLLWVWTLAGCESLASSEIYTEVGRTEYSGAADVFDSWDMRVGVAVPLTDWQGRLGEIADEAAASRRQLELLAHRLPAVAAGRPVDVRPIEVHVGGGDEEPGEDAGGEAPIQLLIGGGAAFLTAAGAALRVWVRRRREGEECQEPETGDDRD